MMFRCVSSIKICDYYLYRTMWNIELSALENITNVLMVHKSEKDGKPLL